MVVLCWRGRVCPFCLHGLHCAAPPKVAAWARVLPCPSLIGVLVAHLSLPRSPLTLLLRELFPTRAPAPPPPLPSSSPSSPSSSLCLIAVARARGLARARTGWCGDQAGSEAVLLPSRSPPSLVAVESTLGKPELPTRRLLLSHAPSLMPSMKHVLFFLDCCVIFYR